MPTDPTQQKIPEKTPKDAKKCQKTPKNAKREAVPIDYLIDVQWTLSMLYPVHVWIQFNIGIFHNT